MRHDISWMLFVLVCNASTKSLVDSILIFFLSALLLMWTVIFLVWHASFSVGALTCFGFDSVCNRGSVVGLGFFEMMFYVTAVVI